MHLLALVPRQRTSQLLGQFADVHGPLQRAWLRRLMARRPAKVVAVALANKMARMAWAIIVHDERYREPAALRLA